MVVMSGGNLLLFLRPFYPCFVRYHSGHKPYANTCHTYLGYPTPTSRVSYTTSAYRVPEVHPTRFQIGRINEPITERFHAGRRTLY